MSTTNAPAYCEIQDVQDALQQADAGMTGSLGDAEVEAAVIGASQWLAKQINAHWYDSNADPSDLISTSAQTASNIFMDVPSSPHPQRGQRVRTSDKIAGTVQYPNTSAGPYVQLRVPYRYVQSIDTLEIRDRGGDVTDWVADSGFTEGRGEDYYLQAEGQDSYGRYYLFLDAGAIGARTHFDNLVTLEITHGLDWDSTPWDDVRRGVAALAAAQLVTDDDVLASLPSDGQLISVETQAQQLMNQALGSDPGYLSAYLETPVA